MIKNILILLFSVQAQASFDSTNLRYLSGHEVTAKLYSVFPEFAKAKENPFYCRIDTNNEAATGMNMPATGRSIYKEPGSAFLNWYLTCANGILNADITRSEVNKSFAHHLGPLLEKANELHKKIEFSISPLNLSAKEFSQDDFAKLVQFQIERLLGPDEVIEELGFTPKAQTLRDEVLAFIKEDIEVSQSMRAIVLKIEFEIISRDEFLVY